MDNEVKYKLYTGILSNKITRLVLPNLEELKRRAAVMAACGLHCGIMNESDDIIHHTNKTDEEYLDSLKKQEAISFQEKSNRWFSKE